MTAGSTPPPSIRARPDGCGIECPSCGCRDLRAVYTRHRPRSIVRKRSCRHCGRDVVTVERVAGAPR